MKRIIKRGQQGTTLIEVLVTIVVMALGMLGLAGLQARLQVSEMEAYQRSQALLLVNDMTTRIASNRTSAALYVTATPLGAGMTCPTTVTTLVQRDLQEWCNNLQGATEVIGTVRVGTLIGGRGCVEADAVPGQFRITVAWQGQVPLNPPAVDCGEGLYSNASGTPCADDRCRRTVTTVVQIANMGLFGSAP